MLSSLDEMTFGELEAALEAAGHKKVHAAALWGRMYGRPLALFPPIPSSLGDWPVSQVTPVASVLDCAISADGLTRKWLVGMRDGEKVETVLMGYRGRQTVCVSTQVGCAMGCLFCATGQMGFIRHLSAGEIVAQVRLAWEETKKEKMAVPRNLVLMGMGEPLHNYDSVMRALEICSERRGLQIGPSRTTISTVGHIPGILRMASENRPYHLAVSLHAACEEERSALMPTTRRWPLQELIEACRTYARITGRRIFFEWALIAGRNDSASHAAQLIQLLKGLDAHVNLIPLNPTSAYREQGSVEAVARTFQQVLRQAGLPATVRGERGLDAEAGCGQLRSRSMVSPS